MAELDFEFRTFSTRSFERFSQVMATHVLGRGIMVFGDGPDGGREATHEGTLNYPSPAEQWSGYTILQAKFRQVPGTPAEDADWLVQQLKAEFDKYDPPSDLRKPDYYILVTNARLSPQPQSERGKGGIAKIDAVFDEYAGRLGLKGYRVWHLDQLSTFLMDAPEIRRSYAAWLMTSDLIADLIDTFHSRGSEVRSAMYRYLARELRAQQPIRLQQAGHSGDAQTMIEDVFTDLPYLMANDFGEEVLGSLLDSLLERSRERLDRDSIKQQIGTAVDRPERILLLGGPGQGKSTVTQFLAQILRAGILKSDRPGEYAAETAKIIESTLTKAEAAKLPVVIPKRFPLRVDLPSFADALSKQASGAPRSLLEYLSQHISAIAGTELRPEDVRRWIADYPTVVILDGLDEVPPSANRDIVIRAIAEFWDEAPMADLLMIVTTRPQGYNDDLDPVLYSTIEMAHLNPGLAIQYANRLAHARIADPQHRDRVLERARAAAESRTTARLMVSPLQVSILLALIDQRGDAPTDRWSLFDTYFDTVLKREQSKTGPVGEAMRHWAHQITSLHYKTGFLLHVEAETQGSSEAYFTSAEFAALIRGQLEEEGFEGGELEKATRELVAASTERLVLIVQREDDRFSFEVRSLQEFVAAAHIMSGKEAKVQARLRSIANRSHWLHVFQIAASKCFSLTDSEQYRDTIITICEDVNENGDEVDRLLRTGSALALSLLDDGLAYDQPKFRRLLLKTAFDILLAGPGPLPESLGDHCAQEPARTVAHIRHYLASTLSDPVAAAWKLLLRCSARQQAWAEPLLDELWPTEPADGIKLFARQVDPPAGTPLHARMRKALEAAKPETIDEIIYRTPHDQRGRRLEQLKRSFPCLELLKSYSDDVTAQIMIESEGTPVSLSFSPLTPSTERRHAYDDIPATPSWAALRAVAAFHRDPGAAQLATCLEEIDAISGASSLHRFANLIPWPLGTALYHHDRGKSLASLAATARAGELGDKEDWIRAEERWANLGITEADFEVWKDGIFFDRRIADVGAPWSAISISHGGDEAGWQNVLIRMGMAMKPLTRDVVRRLIVFSLISHSPVDPITLDEALFLLEDAMKVKQCVEPQSIIAFPRELLENPVMLRRIDEIARSERIFLNHRVALNSNIGVLAKHVQQYPGIVVVLANLIVTERWTSPAELIGKTVLRELEASDCPIVSGYASVLLLVSNLVEVSTVETIFAKARKPNSEFPLFLLEHFLDQKEFPKDHGLGISEAIARAVNANPKLPHRRLMTQIKSFANTRAASLHQPDCWHALDLGEHLHAQTRRRNTKQLPQH